MTLAEVWIILKAPLPCRSDKKSGNKRLANMDLEIRFATSACTFVVG
jgi:hypothetical protein